MVPQVSVVMSVYKNIGFLKYTLESIYNQIDIDFEVILIDDGNSFDDKKKIKDICSKYSNIKLIENEGNLGLTESLIIGCKKAAGKYIARIDNGDIMIPDNRLKLQKKYLDEHSGCAIVAGKMIVIDMLNKKIYKEDISKPKKITSKNIKINTTIFSHITVMFRKDIYFKSGGYDIKQKTGQDTEFWPRILHFGDGYIFNNVFALAFMHNQSISVKNNNIQILDKIKRIYQNKKYDYSILNFGFKFSKILIELPKFALPLKLRTFLKYKKNGWLCLNFPQKEELDVDEIINFAKKNV